jgi:signal transduction histidine kinase
MSESDKELIFEVSDDGIGISGEDLKTLYDPFFRSDNAKNIPGTGLGLPIVKEAVQICGGTISVDSIINKGTKFTVSLPKDKNEISL